MKKRRVLLALVAGLVVVPLGVWYSAPKAGVTRLNAGYLRAGMTRSQVERVMGRAGEEHSDEASGEATGAVVWHGEDISIRARFDPNGRLEYAESDRRDGRSQELPLPAPTPVDRVRLWR